MALDPHSESDDIVLPADYKAEHPDEHPSDWGWHGEWGSTARIAGWIVAAILLVMTTATHYNGMGTLWLVLLAGGMIVALLGDRQRRKHAWRE